MVVSRDGRILYVSESIANYLGLRQVCLSEGEGSWVRRKGRQVGRGEARLGGMEAGREGNTHIGEQRV